MCLSEVKYDSKIPVLDSEAQVTKISVFALIHNTAKIKIGTYNILAPKFRHDGVKFGFLS